MGKPLVSEFMRAAVVEKAERDLARLDQKLAALDTLHAARGSLEALLETLARGTSPVVAVAQDTGAITRFKKLRRAVEEANALAVELAEQLRVDEERDAVLAARAKIAEELASVGEAAAAAE
jgi:tartrate dehydratase alpha subunit/fumarate hydratase class I-like protein